MRRFHPMKAARDWFRVTLPHPAWSITPVILYALTEIINLFADPANAPFEGPGAVLFVVYAVVYGFYRVFYFHPLYRPDYRRWLMSVPWSVDHRLPLGPVHLVPQDLLIVGVMSAITIYRLPITPLAVPIGFFFAYTIGSIVSLGMLEHWTSAVLIFALGALVRFTEAPWMIAAWLGAIFFITLIGYRQTMIDPATWDSTWWGKQGLSDSTGRPDQTLQERNRINVLGWPWDYTSLKRNETPVPFLTGLVISVLVAWWVHALVFHLQRHILGPAQGLYWIMLLPTAIVAIVRVGIYCWGQLPPISILGRLSTFRWIIPGYDKVFIAPLFVLILGWYGPYVLFHWQLEPQYGIPLLTLMIFLTALTMPPSLDEWKFTGNHRITNMVPAQPTEFVRTR